MKKGQATNVQIAAALILLAVAIVVLVLLTTGFASGLQAKTANLPGTAL